jgi:nucleotide-binding universal stress UspA family protein
MTHVANGKWYVGSGPRRFVCMEVGRMYSAILVPVDPGDESTWRRPLETAAALARLSEATLYLLTVVPPMDSPLVAGMLPGDHQQRMAARAQEELSRLIAEHVPATVHAEARVASGRVDQEVIRAARKLGCELIVIGRGGGLRGSRLAGSNTQRVVHRSRIPVMVVGD